MRIKCVQDVKHHVIKIYHISWRARWDTQHVICCFLLGSNTLTQHYSNSPVSIIPQPCGLRLVNAVGRNENKKIWLLYRLNSQVASMTVGIREDHMWITTMFIDLNPHPPIFLVSLVMVTHCRRKTLDELVWLPGSMLLLSSQRESVDLLSFLRQRGLHAAHFV